MMTTIERHITVAAAEPGTEGAPMSDMKVELKESLTRQQAAEKLSALAKSLAEGGDVDLKLGNTTVGIRVADEVRTEFEVEVEGDEFELELELKWSAARAKEPAATARDSERPQPRAIPSL
jgi:amphi-Trp domain-containing protein